MIQDDTDMLPTIAADPPTPPQTPAAPPLSPHRSAGMGWPDPDHGEAGDDPMASGLAVVHPDPHHHVAAPPGRGTGAQRDAVWTSRRHRAQAAQGRSRAMRRNGGDSRWGWIARIW
jgi:hypothetical protein